MNDAQPLYDIQQLSRSFYAGRNLPWKQPRLIAKALEDINLQVMPGEILGLAGESGSGKTTLAEILAGLQTPTSGTVQYNGRDMLTLRGDDWSQFRREVQMIFQDPYESLNPRHTTLRSISEPLINAGIRQQAELVTRATEALSLAGLQPPDAFLRAYPHQLSGGQRQRISIGRAIILKPRVLIADEPVSMLDVSLRAGILKLLRRLRETLGLTILYISHDLSTMSYVCDRIAVMQHGHLKEVGPVEEIFSAPSDPYTRELLAAIPSLT